MENIKSLEDNMKKQVFEYVQLDNIYGYSAIGSLDFTKHKHLNRQT